MTKQGLSAAKAFAKKLPAFRSLAEAERELFSRRDRLLATLRQAAKASSVRLDDSPESLRVLEHWYFELLRGRGWNRLGFRVKSLNNQFQCTLEPYLQLIAQISNGSLTNTLSAPGFMKSVSPVHTSH